MKWPYLYLASQSPRRAQLLAQVEVPFELLLPNAGEDAESLEAKREGEAPKRYVKRVTELKLAAAMERLAQRGLAPAPVLCCDTTVALGARVLGKPRDEADARRMLRSLSGQTHTVHTALALAWPMQRGWQQAEAVHTSRVRFADLSAAQIRTYVATGEPMGKAGAYAIQGGAARFVAHVAGSHSAIMGLPLFELCALLAEHRIEFDKAQI